jgi:hypothetical protein
VLKEDAERTTGLGDLLFGLTTNAISNSSKAVNAQIAMFEPRIGMSREMFYEGMIHRNWEVAGKMWSRKDPDIAAILEDNFALLVRPAEITPRDDQESMNIAVTAVQNRIWAPERGMDRTGVDNTSEEMDAIRAAQTDAALNPNAVMTMLQLMALAKQLGFASPQQGAEQVPQQVSLRDQQLAAMQSATPPPAGGPSANVPTAPAPEQLPTNALAANGAPAAPGTMESQLMLSKGLTTGRVLSSQKIGPQAGA